MLSDDQHKSMQSMATKYTSKNVSFSFPFSLKIRHLPKYQNSHLCYTACYTCSINSCSFLTLIQCISYYCLISKKLVDNE